MKVMRKTRISMALAAAMAGAGITGQVGAVNLSQDNIGDMGVVPYYTVRGGWTTDFFLVNTSNSVVVAKVRFHEARNSRDVLDFAVVLSPYDEFVAWVQDTATGPELRIAKGDTTCTAPEAPVNGQNQRYFKFSSDDYSGASYDDFEQNLPDTDTDDEESNIDRAREGYFTVIMEGATDPDPTHQIDTNAICEELIDPVTVATKTYYDFNRNINALRLNYSITNAAGNGHAGVQGSGVATMFANFGTEASDLAHTVTSVMAGSFDVKKYADEVASLNATLKQINDDISDLKDIIAANDVGPNNVGGPCLNPYTSETNCNATQIAAGEDIAELEDQKVDTLIALGKAQANLKKALQAQLSSPRNLIAAQYKDPSTDYFKYPNLDSGDMAMKLFIDGIYDYNGEIVINPKTKLPFPWAGTLMGHYIRGADAVTALLMHSKVINEWARNPNTGAYNDWVLTAPTKNYYVDTGHVYFDGGNNWHLDLISSLLTEFGQTLGTNNSLPPFGQSFPGNGRSCDSVNWGLWNLNEVGYGPSATLSPWAPPALCWETNVLSFGEESMLSSTLAEFIDVDAALESKGAAPDQRYNGWLQIGLDAKTHNYHPAIPGEFSVAFGIVAGYECPYHLEDGAAILDGPDGPSTASPDAASWQLVEGLNASEPLADRCAAYDSSGNWIGNMSFDGPEVSGTLSGPDCGPTSCEAMPIVADAGHIINDQEYLFDPYLDGTGDCSFGHSHDPVTGDPLPCYEHHGFIEPTGEYWVQTGMPYIGFSFKDRTLGDPNRAFGGLTDHSYQRDFDGRNGLGGQFSGRAAIGEVDYDGGIYVGDGNDFGIIDIWRPNN